MIQTIDKHLTDCQIRELMNPVDQQLDVIHLVADDVASHLENCELCRQRLELSAAESWLWDNASEILEDAPELVNSRRLSESALDTHVAVAETGFTIPSGMLQPPTHPEMLGRIGEFEIERVVGTGGMGIVFKGFDSELHRTVAVKTLAPRFASIGAARKRFSREARAAAAICHENVISIHRIDSMGEFPHIVMPFVSGGSLQEFIEINGPLDPVEIVQIAKQIAAGLAAAHDVGVIHRDIKPANILLENGCNRVLISDFGLAQVESDVSLTRTGLITGTPFYMSPEQAHGNPTEARSDLFALGGIMYFMATGRPPFTASTAMAVLNKICQDKLKDVRLLNSRIPASLANVIHTLLEKNPEHRYKSAAQVNQMLVDYLAHMQQPTVRKQPRIAKPRSMRRRRQWVLTAWACGLVLLPVVWFSFGIGKALLGITPDDPQSHIVPVSPDQQRAANSNKQPDQAAAPPGSQQPYAPNVGNVPGMEKLLGQESVSDQKFGQSVQDIHSAIGQLQLSHGPVFQDSEFENFRYAEDEVANLKQMLKSAEQRNQTEPLNSNVNNQPPSIKNERENKK